jgi:hypothetical protein
MDVGPMRERGKKVGAPSRMSGAVREEKSRDLAWIEWLDGLV